MEQPLASMVRRRGHQHHPRHTTRRRLDISSRGPAQCGPVCNNTHSQHQHSNELPICTPTTVYDNRTGIFNDQSIEDLNHVSSEKKNHQAQLIVTGFNDLEETIRQRPAQCGQSKSPCKSIDDYYYLIDGHELTINNTRCNDQNIVKNEESAKTTPTRLKKKKSPEPEHAVARARGDGHSDDETKFIEEDPEILELAKLRCTSERTEVQSEREARRRKRCADYPGLAFGSSIFSSDTMMKFSLIRNELSNIMGNQLKRVSR